VDGLSAAESVAEDKLAFREFIHNLGVHNGMAGCTTLLLSNERPAHVSDPEHAMVDGIVAMGSELFGQRQVRALEVMKSRGSPQRPGKHNFEITSDGIVAYPRVETVFGARPTSTRSSAAGCCPTPPRWPWARPAEARRHSG
jgi:circadian clock protein KaiC